MAQDHSHRALVLAFCAVVICFFGATVYSEGRMKRLDDYASMIANVSTVRIEALASIRSDAHDLALQLSDSVRRADHGQPVDPKGVSASLAKLDDHLRAFQALRTEGTPTGLRLQVEQTVATLIHASRKALSEIERGNS